MRTRTLTAVLATGFVAAALVPAVAGAQSHADSTFVPQFPKSPEAADPFVADVTPGASAASLPKSAEAAEPFVAEVAPELPTAAPAAIADDGFEWGDALIGAGITLALIAIALAGTGAIGSRRRYAGAPRGAASQGV